MTRMLLAAFLGGLLALPDGAAPAESVKVGEPVVVASGALVAQPHGAFGDGVYLALWQDGWGGVGATAGVKALRLQARTLAPLDREPMVLAGRDPQEAPATAHGGGIFLVVWQEFRAGKHYVIRAARVDARTGRPLGDAFGVAACAVTQCRPTVAWSGKTFLVVWQEHLGGDTHGVRGVRVSPDGKLLDAEPHTYAAEGTSPAVAPSGGKLLVAWAVKQRNQAKTAAALVDPATGQVAQALGAINTWCCRGSWRAAPHLRASSTTPAASATFARARSRTSSTRP